MKITPSQRDRAVKKIEIAIDKLADLQDMGLGCDDITRALEILNSLRNRMEIESNQ